MPRPITETSTSPMPMGPAMLPAPNVAIRPPAAPVPYSTPEGISPEANDSHMFQTSKTAPKAPTTLPAVLPPSLPKAESASTLPMATRSSLPRWPRPAAPTMACRPFLTVGSLMALPVEARKLTPESATPSPRISRPAAVEPFSPLMSLSLMFSALVRFAMSSADSPAFGMVFSSAETTSSICEDESPNSLAKRESFRPVSACLTVATLAASLGSRLRTLSSTTRLAYIVASSLASLRP